MTHDNRNLQLDTGGSRSHRPDRRRAATAPVNRELTPAETAAILETALIRNAARLQGKFVEGISRPSTEVIVNSTHGGFDTPSRAQEPLETSGSGHALVVWHTVF